MIDFCSGLMPEIIWKQSAENDLLQIFGELEDRREGSGEGFVARLDVTLKQHSASSRNRAALRGTDRRLVIGSSGFGLFYSVQACGIIVHAPIG